MIVPFFDNNSVIHLHLAGFYAQNIKKKIAMKNADRANYIELQLRGPGSPGRTCTSITGYLHDKTKISKKNLRVDYYLLLKCCKRQCTLLPLPGQNHLQSKSLYCHNFH